MKITEVQTLLTYVGLQDITPTTEMLPVHLSLLDKLEALIATFKPVVVNNMTVAIKNLNTAPMELIERSDAYEMDIHPTEADYLKEWIKDKKWPGSHVILKSAGALVKTIKNL